MTRDLVRMQYLNTIVGRCDGKEALCQKISDWVGQNTLWVRARIEELRRKEVLEVVEKVEEVELSSFDHIRFD